MTTAQVHNCETVYIESCESDGGLSAFANVRPRLFAIAYRMLQNSAEAEDVLQDVWLRWQESNRSAVQDVPAFLATMTTRLCLNILRSARSRYETFAGPWLPEPVNTRTSPELVAMRRAELKLAIVVLLERLSPAERAAYVLREAFDYSYRQIADILRIAEANSRQLVFRARKHLAEGRHASVAPAEQKRLLDAFIIAAHKGDLSVWEKLLTKDAASQGTASYEDGDGLVHTARGPVFSRDRVAKLVATMSSKLQSGGGGTKLASLSSGVHPN